jgi:flavodoxin
MNVLVAYFSQTGNTKKVAEAIFGEIEATKELKELAEVNHLEGHDLTFLGFPVQAYGPAQQAATFLEEHCAGKDLALFITHATHEDSEQLPEWIAKCRTAAAAANVVGLFNCQGELGEQVADFMLKSGDEKLVAWAKDRPSTLGQPDAARLERARVWAREVMESFSQ